MKRFNQKLIFAFYLALVFLVPIMFLPFTSELFEFNKIILVYILTVLITTAWVVRMIINKKIIFRRTILDIPLALFLISQIVSTIFSINVQTSLFGYYSRFNGGLFSTVAYSLAFWGLVSNLEKKQAIALIKFLLISCLLVCLYAILEHLGIDKTLWVQDVQNRVFSTLGQPNWLAAFVVALMPLTWALNGIWNSKYRIWGKIAEYLLSAIFFLTLLFTKSRSGLIGFAVCDIAFWLVVLLKKRDYLRSLVFHNLIFLSLIFLVGTPWSANISHLLKTRLETNIQRPTTESVIETGGTESGKIREIVWKGAINIWEHHKLVGSGPETFAYSYFLYRPEEHNLVSEWDFLYNKAHNEYLNYLATTGIFGLFSYLVLIGATVFLFAKPLIAKQKAKSSNSSHKLLNYAWFSGYLSILATNFFGFSVVCVSLEFYLFPPLFILINGKKASQTSPAKHFDKKQIIFILASLAVCCWFVFSIAKYWYADVLYASARNLNQSKNYPQAREVLLRAIKITPSQPLFYEELSRSATGLALASFEAGDNSSAKLFGETAIDDINKAISLFANNVTFFKTKSSIFIQLSTIDNQLLLNAADSINQAITLSPTDAKLYYNLGLVYLRLQKVDEAQKILEKAVELKSNYRDAHFALAIVYKQNHDNQKAKEQLNYILDKINSDDTLVKQQLEELK
jgi:putative inorganic carbon (HCO3(-)) transporter